MKSSTHPKGAQATLLIIALALWTNPSHAEDEPPFKQAIKPIAFSFPADHASHAGYQTEWWYFTGNLKDEKGHEFGYQFTIFRRAMAPKDAKERGRKSAWAADDFYLLHLAISDIDGKAHADYESLERGALGIAGATDVSELLKERHDVNLPDHKMIDYPKDKPEPFVRVWTKEAELNRFRNGWQLKASSARIGLDFDLSETSQKLSQIVLHGDRQEIGLSRKGPKPGQASYYYSVPRLETKGTLTLDGAKYQIARGLSWMDHEFGSNQLSPDQAGWEWFSIQLDNGIEIMLYVLRNKDGSIEPSSSGTWIDQQVGRAGYFKVEPAMLKPGRTWKSLQSGAEYPVEWTLKLPKAELHLKTALDDQEFHSKQGAGMNYYEGAIRVEGTFGKQSVKGEGYLEITGKTLGGRM